MTPCCSLTSGSADTIRGNKIAVIIDDATVTGRTIMRGKHQLRKLGFDVIHSMVILDRNDPTLFLNSQTDASEYHFSWWNLYVPDMGTSQSCKICQGIRVLKKTADFTDSGTIKDTIMSWVDNWHKNDSLQRFRSVIPRFEYQNSLKKRLCELETRNVTIHFSEAACAWSLEVAQRSGWFSFLANENDHQLGDALSECLTGVLVHYWDSLHDTHKRALTTKLINRVWNDFRLPARSLVAVCLCSLSERELKTVLKLLRENILEHGIPNFDVAVFMYVVLCIVEKDREGRILWLNKLQNSLISLKAKLGAALLRDTTSFLQAIEITHFSNISGWDVLLSFGLPGRSSDHENINSVIYRLKKSEKPAASQITICRY